MSTGRPSKFTPARRKKLLEAIEAGNFLDVACDLAGIDYATFRRWVKAGEDDDPRFREFCEEVRTATAKAEALHLSVVRRVAIGGQERKKISVRESQVKLPTAPETPATLIETTTTITTEPENWVAAAWLLSRRHPERWGNRAALGQSGEGQTIPLNIMLTPEPPESFVLVVRPDVKVVQPDQDETSPSTFTTGDNEDEHA